MTLTCLNESEVKTADRAELQAREVRQRPIDVQMLAQEEEVL